MVKTSFMVLEPNAASETGHYSSPLAFLQITCISLSNGVSAAGPGVNSIHEVLTMSTLPALLDRDFRYDAAYRKSH